MAEHAAPSYQNVFNSMRCSRRLCASQLECATVQHKVEADAQALYKWGEQHGLPGECIAKSAAAIAIAVEAHQVLLKRLAQYPLSSVRRQASGHGAVMPI